MNFVNLKCLVNKTTALNLLKRSLSSTRYYNASSASSTSDKKSNESDVQPYKPLTEDEIQRITNLDNIHIVTKFQQKKPQRPPLLLNFFISKVDRDMLTYPQVMEAKAFEAMENHLMPITNYFVNNTKAPAEFRFRDISNGNVTDFRNMKLFGSNVLEKYGGKGYFKSEMAWASESEANDLKSYLVMAGHRLAVEAICDHGDESQQNQYLMEMAKGEIIGAACLNDSLSFNGNVTVSKTTTPHGDEYILNGSTSWVVCSQHANLLLVVAKKTESLLAEEAKLEDYDEDVDYDDPNLTFILDVTTDGITIEDQSKTIGCNYVPFVTVNFFNVRIPKSNLLSKSLDERHISQKLLESSRLQASVLNMVQSKKILNQLIEFSIRTKCFGSKLREEQFVVGKLADIAMKLYAVESMIYHSTGNIDQFDNPKVDLESAATKALSQDVLKDLVEFSISLVGKSSTLDAEELGQDIRNAIQLQTLGGSSDALKKYIATKGLEHCVFHLGKNVDDYQDSIWVKMGLSDPHIEFIKAEQRLGDFLHPSFEVSADSIEESIQRLQCSCEILLSRFGEETLSHRIDLRTIGEIAVNTYAMFASVSRSSRAYCIGIRFGQYETVIAANLVEPIKEQIYNQAVDFKFKRNGIMDSQKLVVDRSLDLYKKKISPFLPVSQTGLIRKSNDLK